MKMQERYAELDALRGIASLLVFFFHATMNRQEYNQVFKLGVTGVDLFFIISGFVIFMSLQRVSSGKEFLINRFSRLYPTYWSCVFFTFALIVIHSLYRGDFKINLVELLSNLTMFQHYFGVADMDGSYWTMIIEMVFYILILFLLIYKLLNHVVAVLSIISLSFIAFCFTSNNDKTVSYIIHIFPLVQFIPLFLSGIVFYKIKHKYMTSAYGCIIVVLCLLCQLSLFPYVGRSNFFISWLEYSIMLIAYFFLFWLFVNERLKIIVNSLSLFLGKISFALYLSHSYITFYLVIPLFHDKLGINFWVVVLFINLPAVILVSYVIAYYIERPCSSYIKSKLIRRYTSIV